MAYKIVLCIGIKNKKIQYFVVFCAKYDSNFSICIRDSIRRQIKNIKKVLKKQDKIALVLKTRTFYKDKNILEKQRL